MDLPSWCWASTGAKKIWLPHLRNEELLGIPQTVRIGDAGCLTVFGTLMRPVYSENETSACCITKLVEQLRILGNIFVASGGIEEIMLPAPSATNTLVF